MTRHDVVTALALAILLPAPPSAPAFGGSARPETWRYDAAWLQEPDQRKDSPWRSTGAGAARISTERPPSLRTADASANEDGRFYHLPDAAFALAKRGVLRITARLSVDRSGGHPCATCIQIPLESAPSGPMHLGPLTLGTHGEGHQEVLGVERRMIVLGFHADGDDSAADEMVLYDMAEPGAPRVLARHRLPLRQPRTYVVEIDRQARVEDDALRLMMPDEPVPTRRIPLAEVRPCRQRSSFGLLFGHPASSGIAEARWEFVEVAFTPVETPVSGLTHSPQTTSAPATPLVIGEHRVLFLDDHYIESLEHLSRFVVAPVKHPGNPVLRREKPWEAARCELYGSCVWNPDARRLEMFYTAMKAPYEGKLAYAESTDGGATWHKPDLDIYRHDGRPTNIVWPGRYYVAGPSVIRDESERDPARRYKLFTADVWVGDMPRDKGPQGISVAFSPDGIHWMDPPGGNPVFPDFHSDTGQCVLRDESTGKYIAFVRLRSGNRRSVGRMESTDFVRWTPPRLILTPSPDDIRRSWEFYGMSVTRYQGLYLGLLWIFPATPSSADWSVDAPVTWLELVVSRDGEQFTRAAPGEAFPPLGPPGSFDRRQMRPASSMVDMNDRLLLFYSASRDPHVAAHKFDIGLATIRRDRFIAMRAGDREGSLVTRPLRLNAGRILLNGVTRPGGYIKAELADISGRTVPGYTCEECRAFTGDAVESELCWACGPRAPKSDPSGTRIRFVVKNADLFAFALVE